MAYAPDWWLNLSVEDRAAVVDRIQHAQTGPLPTGLSTRILRAGGELIPVDGAEPDADSPWVLSDDDVDWIYAHGAEPSRPENDPSTAT